MRYDRLDVLRGVAIVWMAVFHFSFDLANFGVTQQNFYRDAVWLHQRTGILSLFLFCAGVGQAVALHHGQLAPRFWRRWGQIAACAVLVTAGSVLMFPQSWIYFGVLHAMAVMLLITRWTGARTDGVWWWLLLGVLFVSLPQVASHPFFDEPWAHWIGLMTHKPRTEDYVPLLPWLGVMFWGAAVGRWLIRHRPTWLTGPVPPSLAGVSMLGRWSLTFYMLHQPIFIGAIGLWLQFLPPLQHP